jgi:hypothetical protein
MFKLIILLFLSINLYSSWEINYTELDESPIDLNEFNLIAKSKINEPIHINIDNKTLSVKILIENIQNKKRTNEIMKIFHDFFNDNNCEIKEVIKSYNTVSNNKQLIVNNNDNVDINNDNDNNIKILENKITLLEKKVETLNKKFKTFKKKKIFIIKKTIKKETIYENFNTKNTLRSFELEQELENFQNNKTFNGTYSY